MCNRHSKKEAECFMEKTMNMAILKICSQGKKDSYRTQKDMRNVINYVLQENKRKENNIWGTVSIFNKTYEGIVEDFLRLKQLYGKTEGLQLKHLVLSWGKRPDIPRKKLRKLIKQTACFWGKDYQTVYAVHEDKSDDKWHMHIVLNSVSNSGSKIQITHKTLKDFRRKFNNIWNPYGYGM